jgi:hypothetical protein
MHILFVIFREKQGLVRNDIMDSIMEMRKEVAECAQGDGENTQNAKRGPNSRKTKHNTKKV